MYKRALVPALALAATAGSIAVGASAAQAAACPAPKVVVTAAHTPITPGTYIYLHGYNFDCAHTGKVTVYPQIFPTSTGQVGNGHQTSVSSAGDFVYDTAAPSVLGPVTVRIDGPTGVLYQNANAFNVVAGSTPATAAPTAVPAGHVAVSHAAGSGNSGAVELAGLAGLVLVGAGVAAGARRRPSRRLHG